MKTKNVLLTVALFTPLCCLADTPEPTGAETWISFLPVIFFTLILIVTILKLRKDGVKLADLLEEKDLAAVPAAIPAGGAPAPAPAYSVSRFIAFLTGLVALVIGICITTFYMYTYFTNPAAKIDFSNFTNVIWGLGIGVLPYGFNKASAAIKQ
jgi:hypothetical protein